MKIWDNNIRKIINSNEIQEWKKARSNLIAIEELRAKMITKVWNLEKKIEEFDTINSCMYEENLKVLSKTKKNTFFNINLSKKLVNLNQKEVELCDNVEFLKELEQTKLQYYKFVQEKKFDIDFREKERQLWNLILDLYFVDKNKYFVDKNKKEINSDCYITWSNNFIEICEKIKNEFTDIDIKDNIDIISNTVFTLIGDIKRDNIFVKNQKIIINN